MSTKSVTPQVQGKTPSAPAPTKTEKAPVDKQAKLKELAAQRIPKVQTYMNLVGNLAAYDPTPEQVAKLVAAIKTCASDAIARLEAPKTAGAKSGFSL